MAVGSASAALCLVAFVNFFYLIRSALSRELWRLKEVNWSVRHSWAFATYLEAFGTTTSLVIGKVPRSVPIQSYAPFLGQLGLILFYTFIVLVMLSIFVSTLNWSVELFRAAPAGDAYFLGRFALLQVRPPSPISSHQPRQPSFGVAEGAGPGQPRPVQAGPPQGARGGYHKGSCGIIGLELVMETLVWRRRHWRRPWRSAGPPSPPPSPNACRRSAIMLGVRVSCCKAKLSYQPIEINRNSI